MKMWLSMAAVLAACSPQDVLNRQGATLRSTDYVQLAMDEQRKQQAQKEAEERRAAAQREPILKAISRGDAHMDLFEYEQAAAEYKEAYRLSSDLALLLRIAEAERATGDCVEAESVYKQYLDKKKPGPNDTPDLKTIQARMDQARACQKKAGSKVEDVRALYQRGVTHYDLAEYDRAVVAFKEAYRLSNDPAYLFNVAQSYRLAKNCNEAMTFYQSFLRNSPDAPNKEKIEARIVEMKACAK